MRFILYLSEKIAFLRYKNRERHRSNRSGRLEAAQLRVYAAVFKKKKKKTLARADRSCRRLRAALTCELQRSNRSGRLEAAELRVYAAVFKKNKTKIH